MLTLQEMQAFMRELKDWALEGDMISKVFSFESFKDSLDFLNKVGEVALRLDHHPDVVISLGMVKLSLTTHSEGGVSKKDFEFAGEIDKI